MPRLLVALLYPSLAVATDIWQVHLRYGPAPAPSLRPPFSRGATLNPSNLKWQIPLLVGSYVVVALFIGVCLLTFGRRMRSVAQSQKSPRSMEMVKPMASNLDPTPPPSTSPLWRKWGSPKLGFSKSPGMNSTKSKGSSPGTESIVSFDPHVIQSDQAKRQEEMERIYDEILANDLKAQNTVHVQEREVQEDSQQGGAYYGHTRSLSSSSKSFSRLHPPQSPAAQQFSYPAQSPPLTASLHGTYPQKSASVTRAQPAPSRPMSPPDANQRPPPYSHTRQPSNASTRSKKSFSSVRSMPISSPIPVPTLQDEFDVKAPLSPKFGREIRPPTPPTPGGRRHTIIEDDSDTETEEPPMPAPLHSAPIHQMDDDAAHMDQDLIAEGIIGSYQLRTPRPLPSTAPQRSDPRVYTDYNNKNNVTVSNTSLPQSQQVARTNTPGAYSISTSTKGAGSSTHTLPFRAIHPPAGIAAQMISPSANQPTFLSPHRAGFLPTGMHHMGENGLVPNSAALLSAGLATPYSPYMPQSAMMPLSPRMTTRRERKEMERDTVRQAATQEDVVQDDKDMWGDGYA